MSKKTAKQKKTFEDFFKSVGTTLGILSEEETNELACGEVKLDAIIEA